MIPFVRKGIRMTKHKTGFDKYFEEQMKSPSFQKGFEKAYRQIKSYDQRLDYYLSLIKVWALLLLFFFILSHLI